MVDGQVNEEVRAGRRPAPDRQGALDDWLRAPRTLTVRAYACGKANCRCKSDPAARHGPYAYWTRKVGSTAKTRVLTQGQLEDYREWLDNARRLKKLVAELHELSVSIIDEDPRGLRADRKRVATAASAPRRPARKAAR